MGKLTPDSVDKINHIKASTKCYTFVTQAHFGILCNEYVTNERP